MGIHSTQISSLERGRENPSYERLVELATTLGISTVALVEMAEQRFDEAKS